MSIKSILASATLASSMLAGSVADAHPRLSSTYPAANSGVRGTNRISLSFSERLMPSMTGADVLMTGHPSQPHHAPMKMAGFTPSVIGGGKTLQLLSQRPLPKGSYRVQWHAVAADTHRVAGAFAFMVK